LLLLVLPRDEATRPTFPRETPASLFFMRPERLPQTPTVSSGVLPLTVVVLRVAVPPVVL
jgi:hypothetical protein